MADENKEWEIGSDIDSITPGNVHFSEKSFRAKLIKKDGSVSRKCGRRKFTAHANSSMTATPAILRGRPPVRCHLQMTANARQAHAAQQGLLTKNYTSYNFQVLRDDIYMLGVDGTVTGHRIAPARSSCAVLVEFAERESRLALLHAADI